MYAHVFCLISLTVRFSWLIPKCLLLHDFCSLLNQLSSPLFPFIFRVTAEFLMNKPPKGLFIFFYFIFLVSIITFAYCDCNNQITDNEVFLTQDTYRTLINDRISFFSFILIIPVCSFNPTVLVLVRAPPVYPSSSLWLLRRNLFQI